MVQKAIDSRAHVIACNDPDSDKEEWVFLYAFCWFLSLTIYAFVHSGVGEAIAELSNPPANVNDAKDPADAQVLSDCNGDREDDAENNAAPPNDSQLAEEAPNSATQSAFSAWSQTQRASQVGPVRHGSS